MKSGLIHKRHIRSQCPTHHLLLPRLPLLTYSTAKLPPIAYLHLHDSRLHSFIYLFWLVPALTLNPPSKLRFTFNCTPPLAPDPSPLASSGCKQCDQDSLIVRTTSSSDFWLASNFSSNSSCRRISSLSYSALIRSSVFAASTGGVELENPDTEVEPFDLT